MYKLAHHLKFEIKKQFTLLNFVKFDLNYKILALASLHALQVCNEALKSDMRLA